MNTGSPMRDNSPKRSLTKVDVESASLNNDMRLIHVAYHVANFDELDVRILGAFADEREAWECVFYNICESEAFSDLFDVIDDGDVEDEIQKSMDELKASKGEWKSKTDEVFDLLTKKCVEYECSLNGSWDVRVTELKEQTSHCVALSQSTAGLSLRDDLRSVTLHRFHLYSIWRD